MSELRTYKVRLTYLYSDTIEVDATSKQEAIELASLEANEEFECALDAEVTEI